VHRINTEKKTKTLVIKSVNEIPKLKQQIPKNLNQQYPNFKLAIGVFGRW
jgi:hypothetical protein